jgi:hypothetical protein
MTSNTGRALLRLRDERLDVFLRRVGVDLERHLDVVVAVADVAVDAKDAADVHLAFEIRFDRAQLNAAILRDCRHTGGQAARETDQHVLDRRDGVILRGEDLRMIRAERRLGLVLLFLPEPEEALDFRLAVRAVLPLAGRPPREFRRLRRAFRASRASSSAWTFTPLLTTVVAIEELLVELWTLSSGWQKSYDTTPTTSRRRTRRGPPSCFGLAPEPGQA